MNKLEKSKRLSIGEWIYYYVHRYWRYKLCFENILTVSRVFKFFI